MKKLELGYTKKWIAYNFLNKNILSQQLTEFKKGGDQNIEHYRYASFVNWLDKKSKLTDQEVNHYLELAGEDVDVQMGGTAIKDLFVSPKITKQQFELIKSKLPEFGDWTKKLIAREVLIRRLNKEELTKELFNQCFKYKNEFNDNRLLILIIKKTNKLEILSLFLEVEIGKKIKTLASNKISKLEKAADKK